MKKNKKRIIILSVLFVLSLSTLIFAANATQRSSIEEMLVANAESNVYAAIAEDGNEVPYIENNGSDMGISPMGWWEDLWNIPEEINVYGTLHVGNKDTTVSNATYTNQAYGYTSPSGFPQFQTSRDGDSWDVTYLGTHAMFSNSNANGWRYFRGYKPSPKGDYTKVSYLCLDTEKPQIQARINGSSVGNGTITTSSSAVISILGADTLSGVNTYWYTMNGYGGTYYQCYSNSTFSSDGVYTFYCKDRAGNVSDTVTVTKDTTAPTVKAYNGSSSIANGAIVNASSARFEATDATSGVAAIYIRTPGSSSYTNYGTSATLSTVGLYYYYAKDNAGNQSSTYTFTIDRTAPTVTLYSGTTSVSSGYFSAASYIRFTASDTNGCTVYMKKDSGSYATYTSGTNQTAEGVYSFYAVDPAGNSTSTYTITLDRTSPVGTLYAGTTTVASGKITNASYIKYTATDNLALNTLYVRMPGTSSYVSYTSGTQYTADGTYYFYATDKSGNASTTVSIVLDKTKPTVAINTTAGVVPSGSFTNSASVKFSASDATSGVANMYIRLPGSSTYISYVAETPFTTEGIYYFYATDVAGNTSDTVNVTVDRTLPVGTLTANGSTVTSGTFTNKAFYYTATDSLSGIAKYEIKRPGGNWETYTSGTSIPASSTQGLYIFRATDKAGNISAESQITLVTTAPTVTIYAGSTVVSSGSYVNSSYIAFTATGSYGVAVNLFVKIPGSANFTSYISGTQLTKEGLYSFYATDNAGNTSATVTVTLDITKPIGALTANGSTVTSGTFTNKAFYYSATDGGSGISKCEIKKPGGAWETYISGTTIAASSAQGLYTFRATDKAGNVSDEMKINLVTSAPVVTLYAETTVITSGSYTNKSYVAFTATANYGATVSLYVKIPGSSSFALYASLTQLSKEGKYEVYATDNAGNTSATLNITLDVTKPTGTLTANGVTVASGTFTNKAFSFAATDSVSGLSKCEIKRPGGAWETYISGTSIPASSTQGLYTFRATDNAGNISVESQINLVTSAPVITLYAGTTTVSSGTFTNKSYVAFTVSASLGATASLYVKMPDAGSFTLYAAGTQLSKEGKYEIYASDNAGNTSSTLNITLDISSPVGTITAGGTSVTNGDYVNSAFKYSANDSISGIAKLEILRPNGTWQAYGGEEISIGSGNGLYSFRATDKAGNVSAESKVHLLTNVPSVQLYADEQLVSNGTFTNAARISMSASGGTSLTCYVKIPGASSFSVYNQYYAYTASGRYEFYCQDQAGNNSGVFTIIIDRTTKPVSLTGVNGDKATGDVSATWGNGSTTIAGIVSVTVNGIAYTKSTVIKTIGSGVYNIKTVDAAGNVWTFAFTAVRTEVLSETVNMQYFETKSSAGTAYAFDSYDKALAFAKERENSYVRTATWSGTVWDGGIAIDSIDSPNAKNGTYYIYKKSGDKNTEVAYFTLARLNAVIAEYAVESVNSYFWWEKAPAQSYTGNDLVALKSNKVFIGSSISLASHAKYLVDGQSLTGLTYSTEGIHTLKVYDDYGNSYEYTLKIVRRISEVSYMVEGGTWNVADSDRQYRFTKSVTIKATDLVDDFAMFYVKNSAGEIIAKVNLDTEYVINKSGQYTIIAVNHFGASKEISFILSLNAPTATFTNNMQTKRLELRVVSSIDSTVSLSDIKIYRSTDNGKTWVLLAVDDYENAVSKNRLFYEFNKDGSYRVVIEDNFRIGIEAVIFEADYAKPDPSGSLIGVSDGGYTNTPVRFVWSDEAVVYLTYNGATAGYLSGTEITAQGFYVLEFRDENGYCKVYVFTIDSAKPTGAIMINGGAVQSGGYTNKAFSYSASDNLSGISKYEIKRPGGNWEIYNGEEIKANAGDGNYAFRAYDYAGNISAESLIILVTSKPTVTIYAGTDAVPSGTNSNKNYITFTATSAAGVTMYVKAPGASDYTVYSGTQLSGEGVYYFYAVDAAGNVSETLTATLDKSSPIGTITADGAAAESGSYTNKAFKFTASDSISGVARCEIKRPGGNWEVYYGEEVKTNAGDGNYTFRAFDIAGNASAEICIYLITTSPETKIYAGTDIAASGANTNKNYITFTATSAASVTRYVKLPGASNYIAYTGTQLSGEGVYYFYAVDITGNTSETVSIVLDKTIPVGTIATESINGYTNKAFSYSATDSLSGIARYEIKRPSGNWEVYSGVEIKANAGDGNYLFRAIDLAGNVSVESYIYLITEKPTVTIYADTQTVLSGTNTNKSYVFFSVSIAKAGETVMYIRVPNSNEYVLYVAGTKMYTEGTHFVYAIDAAGNVSTTVSITLDNTSPIGTITSGGLIIENGGYTNKAFAFFAIDNVSGIARYEIKHPGGAWKTYSGEEITSTVGDGWYSFRAFDVAGNVSAEVRVYLITSAPDTKIYAEAEMISSGTSTNKKHITFTASSVTDVTMYVKIPDMSGYVLYDGAQLTIEGTYCFFAVDITGNVSETVFVTLDRTKPVGAITTESVNGYTNKAFSYSADDMLSGVARLEIKKPNGSWVTYNGEEMKANAGDGYYAFRAIDLAGNISAESLIYLITAKPTTAIYAGTEAVASGTHINRSYITFTANSAAPLTMYVKIPNVGGYVIYDGAQLSAEGAYHFYAIDPAGNLSETVTVTLDKSIPVGIITSNGSTVQSGGYTNKAFTYAATDTISGIARYEIKRPGGNWEAYTGEEIKANSGDGNYVFRAIDLAGNVSAEISIYLITSKPIVTIYAGTEAVSSGISTNKSYITFTAYSAVSVTMYVKVPGANDYTVYNGLQLNGEGTYYFYSVDITGNLSNTVNVTLDKSKPIGNISSDSTSGYTNKAFSYSAVDNVSGVSKCEIKRPNGNWETYNGEEIKANSGDGIYAFRAIDFAGNVSDESRIHLTTSQLGIIIYAEAEVVPNGAKTNKGYLVFSVVSATDATMYVKLPGASEYTVYKGTQLNGEGVYHLYASDLAGGVSETVVVTLDKSKPVGLIETDSVNGYTNKAFSYNAADSLSGIARFEIKRPGGNWEVYNGEQIKTNSGDGSYIFRAFDYAGNVSSESSIYLITSKPIVTIYAGTGVVSNGTNTNKSYVSFTASSVAGVTMYVKTPGASNYIIYSEIQLSNEGIYYAYAIDGAGNVSENVTITLDKSSPIGTITVNSEVVLNGSYVNKAFTYAAIDNISGIERYEIKRPGGNWESYSGDEIKANSGDGYYAFRAFDFAGNASLENGIYLLTSKPAITIYAGSEMLQSGAVTNKSYISFAANSVSGVTMYVKTPGTSDYSVYSAVQLSMEGRYYFYAIDLAGNISETVTVILDKSSPVGTIMSDGTILQSGSYTNQPFAYTATDNLSGIERLEIKRPGGNWEDYNGEEIAADSEGGQYIFRAYDTAGNMSAESIVNFLTLKPMVQLYANESPVNNGTYTSAARISMSASGITDVTCYVRLPEGDFIIYNQYFSYSAAGRYEFYAIDKAGNKSDLYIVIIDRISKPVTISGINDGIASGDVSLIWIDGDGKTTANIISVSINGYEYNKGDIIRTIDGGSYNIKTTDAAGNIWTSTFTAARTEVLSETLNKEFWETQGKDGKTYAFSSYDSALSFAIERENVKVRTAVWNGSTWDGGIPMDAVDSANAKNGTYYIYKKSGDKNTEVAYFTLARLNAIINEYATESVNSYYWWEKTPAVSAQTENLHLLALDQTFIGSSVSLAGHANYLIDGKVLSGLQYSTEGRHILTVYDDFGNSYEYTLVIVRSMPSVMYALGEGTGNIAAFDRTYYFNVTVTVFIADEYDEFAMFNVYAENGKKVASLSLGEKITLDKSGKYTVQAINHFGTTQVFTLTISLEAPKAEIIENTKGKKLEIKVSESSDSHSHIQTMEIYKSTDDGTTWILIDKDDYGNTVSSGRYLYSFRTSGLYKIIITDEFRSGINAIIVQYNYIQDNPEGKLIGVDNGGYTNGKVSFEWSDEAKVTLEKDGVKINYSSGLNLDADGSYVLTFENYDGYKAIYSFVIDTVAPIMDTDGVKNGEVVNKDVVVSWDESNLNSELYENGNLVGEYESGTKLTESGNYRIVITDAAGNKVEISFTIDKFVDFTINVNDKGLANSVTVNANEELNVVIEKDGEIISYSLEDSITAEGHYVLILTDKLGNSKELSFTIINAPLQSFEYDFGIMPGLESVTVDGEDYNSMDSILKLSDNILELNVDGSYEICVVARGESYIFTIVIDATAPTLILNGVEDGGSTKGAVKLTEISESAKIKVFLDGEEIEYELGASLTQPGKYLVVLEDDCGNVREYSFEILKSVNGGVIALVIIIIIALIGGGVFLFLKKRKIV